MGLQMLSYKLTKGAADKAEALVNELIAAGWALYGSPSVYISNGVTFFAQALTKDDSPPTEKD